MIELLQIVTKRMECARTARDYFSMKDKQGASLAEMYACATDCMNDYEAQIEAMAALIDRLSGKDAEGGAE